VRRAQDIKVFWFFSSEKNGFLTSRSPIVLQGWRLAALYGVFGLLFTLLLALEVPPIQGADEGAHFARADEISGGEFFAYRIGPGASGGRIDRGVIAAVDRFFPLIPDINSRVTAAMSAPIPWGQRLPWSFPNTAVYPPVFYLPAAAAIVFGKHVGLDVSQTEDLARVGGAIASVAIGALAIGLAGPAGCWLFAVLLLPSSAFLMASVTQDGPMLAGAALAASLMQRLQRMGAPWKAELALLCVILALLGMCRPPYAALAALPLATLGPPKRARYLGAAASLSAAMAWWIFCAVAIFVPFDPLHHVGAGAQLQLVLAHPGRLIEVVSNTVQDHFAKEYAGYFITTFVEPGLYTGAAWISLALALCATRAGGFAIGLRQSGLICTAVLVSVAGLFAVQYLSWTAIGAHSIDGVLGRYFLPLAAILVAAIVGPQVRRSRLAGWVAVPVLLFPVASIVVSVHAVVARYYSP